MGGKWDIDEAELKHPRRSMVKSGDNAALGDLLAQPHQQETVRALVRLLQQYEPFSAHVTRELIRTEAIQAMLK